MVSHRFYLKRSKRRRDDRVEDFDTSPVADLAFLLLIFFIVTSSFILRQGLFLSLPSKSAGAVKVDQKKLFQIIPENEYFVYQARKYSEDELKNEIQKKLKEINDLIVVIQMKADVKYDRLVSALSIAKSLGVKKISIKDV